LKKSGSFYSSGKFLISGEYLVLKGARSLAVPLKFGQSLELFHRNEPAGKLRWCAFEYDRLWFSADFDLESLKIIETNDPPKAQTLAKILKHAHRLNPHILPGYLSLEINTRTDFDINWGLGTSSTLIANVAKWFKINPFDLHFATSTGSGYDVACAMAESPIFYTLHNQHPVIEHVSFAPDFKQNIYFVYLGKKQQSHQSIKDFRDKLIGREKEIERISEISAGLASAHNLEEFEFLIDEHEKIMADILEIPGIKETTYPDFPGAVKSLGAWGGDFILMTWRGNLDELKNYLSKKGFDVVFTFDKIVLQQKSKS